MVVSWEDGEWGGGEFTRDDDDFLVGGHDVCLVTVVIKIAGLLL